MIQKVTQQFTVDNEDGLHARPSASLVKKANEFRSNIQLCVENGDSVNCKSIIGILCLGAAQGTKITVTAEGEDAAEAIYALKQLFKNKFEESR